MLKCVFWARVNSRANRVKVILKALFGSKTFDQVGDFVLNLLVLKKVVLVLESQTNVMLGTREHTCSSFINVVIDDFEIYLRELIRFDTF